MDSVLEVSKIIIILFTAVVFHEFAHGWAANKLGDPTARLAGRLTLNPIKHIDLIGTIVLPGILITLRILGYPVFIFGWAKPVPVNFLRLNHPKRDMMLVALAGPLVNIIIAFIFSRLIAHNVLSSHFYLYYMAIFLNLLLAVFNMIPIPPLDGSRVVMGLLPNNLSREYSKIEPFGLLIVVGLLYLGVFAQFVLPVVNIIGHWMGVNFP